MAGMVHTGACLGAHAPRSFFRQRDVVTKDKKQTQPAQPRATQNNNDDHRHSNLGKLLDFCNEHDKLQTGRVMSQDLIKDLHH